MPEVLAPAWLLWSGFMIWAAWCRQIRALVASAILPLFLAAAFLMLTAGEAMNEATDNGAGFGMAVLVVFGGPALFVPIVVAAIVYAVRRPWSPRSATVQDKAHR